MRSNFLTVEQAADRLRIKPYTMRSWLRAGRMRGVKIGRDWRIEEREVSKLSHDSAPETNQMQEFLQQAQALQSALRAEGFEGINGADLVREVRSSDEENSAEYSQDTAAHE